MVLYMVFNGELKKSLMAINGDILYALMANYMGITC